MLTAIGPEGNDVLLEHNMIHVLDPTGVARESGLPSRYALHQNLPNPFNMETRFMYDLPEPGFVEIKLYDAGGHFIRDLVRRQQPAGCHQAVWDGNDAQGNGVSTGIYLLQMAAGSFTAHRKIMLIK